MSLTREKKLHRNLKHYYNRVSLSPFRPTNSHFLTSVSASCMCKCHVSSVIWTYLVKKTKAPFLSWTFSIMYFLGCWKGVVCIGGWRKGKRNKNFSWLEYI